MKSFLLSATTSVTILFLSGCATHGLQQVRGKSYEVTLYQSLSEIDHYALTPVLDQLKVENLKPGETKKLLFKTKRKNIRSSLRDHHNLEVVLARGSRPVSIQKIDYYDTLFIEADITQLLEMAKAGDRLIVASGDGAYVYKVTYFI